MSAIFYTKNINCDENYRYQKKNTENSAELKSDPTFGFGVVVQQKGMFGVNTISDKHCHTSRW